MSRNPSTLTSSTNLNHPQSGVMDPEHVFVPDENAVGHTRGVLEYDAQSEHEPKPREEVQKHSSETEPHGMYWHRANGVLVLKPHAWFLADVAKTADQVLATAIKECSDADTQSLIRDMANALREYIECRRAINSMAGDRKLKGEADDACYQLAQSAKYFIDAGEAAKRCIDSGYSIDGNKRIDGLKERSQVAMREGYMIAQAVILAANIPPVFDMKLATKRVVEYSCRKLTEWFAARREHTDARDANRESGAKLDLENFLKR